jgi:hypothetical protein
MTTKPVPVRRPGRPTTNPLTKKIEARVSPAQHDKFVALGGSEWLRAALDAATVKDEDAS